LALASPLKARARTGRPLAVLHNSRAFARQPDLKDDRAGGYLAGLKTKRGRNIFFGRATSKSSANHGRP